MLPNFEAPRTAKNLQPDSVTQSPDPTCTLGSPSSSKSFPYIVYLLKSNWKTRPALVLSSIRPHWKRHGDHGENHQNRLETKTTKSEENLVRPFSEQVELRVRLLYGLATKPQCSSSLRTYPQMAQIV